MEEGILCTNIDEHHTCEPDKPKEYHIDPEKKKDLVSEIHEKNTEFQQSVQSLILAHASEGLVLTRQSACNLIREGEKAKRIELNEEHMSDHDWYVTYRF